MIWKSKDLSRLVSKILISKEKKAKENEKKN